MTDNKGIIEFPCDFPVKIIGNNSPTFVEEIRAIVATHFPDFDEQFLKKNHSKNVNYIGLTVTVYALNQPMLDAFYRELTSHPEVKMVL